MFNLKQSFIARLLTIGALTGAIGMPYHNQTIRAPRFHGGRGYRGRHTDIRNKPNPAGTKLMRKFIRNGGSSYAADLKRMGVRCSENEYLYR